MKKTKFVLSGKIKYIIILHAFWPVQFKDQPRIRYVVLFLRVEWGSWPVLHHLASEQLVLVAGPHACQSRKCPLLWPLLVRSDC